MVLKERLGLGYKLDVVGLDEFIRKEGREEKGKVLVLRFFCMVLRFIEEEL